MVVGVDGLFFTCRYDGCSLVIDDTKFVSDNSFSLTHAQNMLLSDIFWIWGCFHNAIVIEDDELDSDNSFTIILNIT